MYLCCRKFGQLRDSKQSITVSTVNGKCVPLSIGIYSPLFELHERLHSFQMFQASQISKVAGGENRSDLPDVVVNH